MLLVPGTASAETIWGDPDCQSQPEVPDSGIAMSGPSVSGLRYDQAVPVSVFGIGADRQVWYRQIGGPVGSWQPLGGRSAYGPAAVYSGTTSHVLVTGGDGAVWVRSDAGGGWGPWISLGGYFVSSPAAASLGPGTCACSAEVPTMRCGATSSPRAGRAGTHWVACSHRGRWRPPTRGSAVSRPR